MVVLLLALQLIRRRLWFPPPWIQLSDLWTAPVESLLPGRLQSCQEPGLRHRLRRHRLSFLSTHPAALHALSDGPLAIPHSKKAPPAPFIIRLSKYMYVFV